MLLISPLQILKRLHPDAIMPHGYELLFCCQWLKLSCGTEFIVNSTASQTKNHIEQLVLETLIYTLYLKFHTLWSKDSTSLYACVLYNILFFLYMKCEHSCASRTPSKNGYLYKEQDLLPASFCKLTTHHFLSLKKRHQAGLYI